MAGILENQKKGTSVLPAIPGMNSTAPALLADARRVSTPPTVPRHPPQRRPLPCDRRGMPSAAPDLRTDARRVSTLPASPGPATAPPLALRQNGGAIFLSQPRAPYFLNQGFQF